MWLINIFNSLIVWNNPSGVDVPLTEPGGSSYKPRWLLCTSRKWKLSQSEFLSKDVGPFLKIFFFGCFFQIFEDVSSLTIFFSKMLQDILNDVLKTCLEDVFKMSWSQTKCLLGIFISNKSKCVSKKCIFHKSISDKSKANPKCIN